jgi:hypothetical protein
MRFTLKRDVTKKECHWLDEDMKKGSFVYRYDDYTYGLISPGGVAVTLIDGELPFFELPFDALE